MTDSVSSSMTISSQLFVANARTALKIAFNQLDVKRGGKILVPDFICDVLIHPMLQAGLVPFYYPVTQDLVPDWRALESMAAGSDCQAIIMVHYFGQPQNIEQFQLFCSRHSLLLVEDNAHGYGGYHAGKLLGSFGDVGISSPRKILGTPSGGIFHGASIRSSELVKNMSPFPAYHPIPFLKAVLNLVPRIRRLVKGWSDRSKNWSDPRLHQESVKPDHGIDRFSRWRIVSADLQLIAARRRENWLAWALFARSKGLRTVFSELHPESCPWAMPVYASDLVERNLWLAWGAKNGITVFPWPTLPDDIILLDGDALARWEKLLCFSLDRSPPIGNNL
jgi:perosamine synthetase